MLRLLRPTLSEITADPSIYRHFRRMEMSIADGRPTEFMGRKIGTPCVVSWNKIRHPTYDARFVSVIPGGVCALKKREMFLRDIHGHWRLGSFIEKVARSVPHFVLLVLVGCWRVPV